MARLTKDKVEKIIKRKQKGLSSRYIAHQLDISKRRINQIWRKFQTNGSVVLKRPGRPKSRVLSEQEQRTILALHEHQRMGARVLGYLLRSRYGWKIGNILIHSLLLKNSMAFSNPNKQKRRKDWIRYQREHSLTAVHMDWHTTKWIDGVEVCTIIDDCSRKILAAVETAAATAEESIRLIKDVLAEYGHIRRIEEIITDHGTQFFNNKPDNNGELQPNSFQLFLASQGIRHILARIKHPQTNGKQEKWFDTYEKHRGMFGSMEGFVRWYNATRVHESLDLQTPEKVFWERLQPFLYETAGRFFKCQEQKE